MPAGDRRKKKGADEGELTSTNVAEMFGMSPQWVHDRVKDGTLPFYRKWRNGRPLFRREDIQKYFDEHIAPFRVNGAAK